MRIKVESDLHIGMNRTYMPKGLEDTDVYIIPGDCGEFAEALKFCDKLLLLYSHLHIIMIGGNHFYYNTERYSIAQINRFAKAFHARLHFLDNDYVDIEETRFIGATLWSDFNKMHPEAVNESRCRMNDYNYIYDGTDSKLFTPYMANFRCEYSREYIFNMLNESHLPCIVITHNVPYWDDPKDLLYYSYHVDLTKEFSDCPKGNLPRYWFHGHTHESSFKEVSGVSVISNQLGYPHQRHITNFNPNLVIELPSKATTEISNEHPENIPSHQDGAGKTEHKEHKDI